jgi:RNA polymerase sigma factor (sigma-70 family)
MIVTTKCGCQRQVRQEPEKTIFIVGAAAYYSKVWDEKKSALLRELHKQYLNAPTSKARDAALIGLLEHAHNPVIRCVNRTLWIENIKDEDDILIEIFTKVEANLTKLEDGAKFIGWAVAIAHNHCYDINKKSRRIKFVDPDELVEIADEIAPFKDETIPTLSEAELDALLQNLEEDCRWLINQRYYFEETLVRIGVMVGVGKAAIQKRFRRCVEKAKVLFFKQYPI